MKYLMDTQEIIKYLPHRYPFLLIDRILELVKGQSIIALKNVTMNEPYFMGHFPNKPVMPGVIIVEAMAQAGGVLAYQSTGDDPKNTLYYFAGIDEARFRKVVVPGDQLRIEVKVLKTKRAVWKLSGNAFVEDDLVCSAHFLSARKED